jgi:hypothetical protein
VSGAYGKQVPIVDCTRVKRGGYGFECDSCLRWNEQSAILVNYADGEIGASGQEKNLYLSAALLPSLICGRVERQTHLVP